MFYSFRRLFRSGIDTDTSVLSPIGRSRQMWSEGVFIAIIPFAYGVYCLYTGTCYLPGRRGVGMQLTGTAATAMASAYIAIGVFIHAHGFWGNHDTLVRYSGILKLLAGLTFIAGFGYVIYDVLFA